MNDVKVVTNDLLKSTVFSKVPVPWLSIFLWLHVFDLSQVADLWEVLQPCGNSHRRSGRHLQRQGGCTNEARGKRCH